MKHESKQPERPEQWDPSSLIPEETVRGYAKKYGLGNYCDDLLQEVRLALHEARNRGLEVSPAYAFGILRHKVRDKLEERDRRRAFERSLENLTKMGPGVSGTDCPEDAAQRKELSERVRDIVDQLPLRLKVVLNLRLFEKFTFREVGRVIHMSEATARDDYRRALEFVRRRLEAAEARESESDMILDIQAPPIERATCIRNRKQWTNA